MANLCWISLEELIALLPEPKAKKRGNHEKRTA
jgi:hypothetical protein